MWLLVKTLMTCLLLAIMSWFFHRVRQLDRQLNVIERWLTALAVSTLLLNGELYTCKANCKPVK